MAGSFNEVLYIFLLTSSPGWDLSAAHFTASPRRGSCLRGRPLRETTGRARAVHVFRAGKEQSRLRGAAFSDPQGGLPSGKGFRRDKGRLHGEGWSCTPSLHPVSLVRALHMNLFGVEGCSAGSTGFGLSLSHARVLRFSGVCLFVFLPFALFLLCRKPTFSS